MKLRAGELHVETGPIGRVLFSFAVPVLAGQLLQELYNVTDCMVVGHFGGDNALAAVGIAGLLLSVLINFFIGFSSGVSAMTARQFGAYDYRALRRTVNTVLRLGAAAGACATVPALLWADGILGLLRCPAPVLPRAAAYLRVCSGALAAQLIYNVGASVLRSLGDTKTPLLCFMLSAACNLGLDALFVIVLGWGVEGAAAATLLSQWLLAVLIGRRLMGLDSRYAFSLTGPGLTRRELGSLLGTGIPAGMQAFFMSASSLLIQRSINGFGPEAIAGMNLFAKLEGWVYLPSFAYGIALTGFVGQNLGARRMDRVREAVRLSALTMLALILPLSLLLTALAPQLLRLFTADGEILRAAREAVRCILLFYVVYAINQVLLGAVKGMGDTAWPMVCTLLCYSLFRVAWCWMLIPRYATMRVVYFSYDVSFFLMLGLLLPAYVRLVRMGREHVTHGKPQ